MTIPSGHVHTSLRPIFADHAVEAIVVGASAGGIDAMLTIFSQLPAQFRLPVVALLHMADSGESRLAEVFAHRLAVPVKEAEDKETIRDGMLYFAPPGYHLSIEPDRSFSLSCEPPVNFSRPSIDLLMESAADAYGERLVGILLTGANHDGAAGLLKIRCNGGLTVVQEPAEARVRIMPQEALKLQRPDYVLPLAQIGQLILMLENQYAARSRH